jgi:hypothetical protein
LRIAPKIDPAEIKYLQYENSTTIGDFDKNVAISVFGSHDELFSYKSLFEKLYGANLSFGMNDAHWISTENISDVIFPLIHKLPSPF